MLSEKDYEVDAHWSPNGKQLVFGRTPFMPGSSEKVDIRILDVASKQISIIPGSENLYAPRWSPDGQYLAALSADSKKLLLFEFRTQRWKEWINEPGALAYPTWSRDGRYVYYDNFSTKSPGYRRVKVGQTRSEFLIDLKDLHRLGFFSMWSGIAPDGSALFTRDLSTDEIYSLDLELP